MQKTILSFGETLWDLFPSGPSPRSSAQRPDPLPLALGWCPFPLWSDSSASATVTSPALSSINLERITVSIGAATTRHGLSTAGALLAASDAALYDAKLNGGDQVAAAPSEVVALDR